VCKIGSNLSYLKIWVRKYHVVVARCSEVPPPDPSLRRRLPLKIFFLLVSIGLFVSALSGLYMSYKYIRSRRLITAILLAGIIVPILLTIF
jgi:hypothetical protein